MTTFDPNAPAFSDSGIFGLNASVEDAKMILIPVPWEATTSYGGGTSLGPEAIFNASKQVDLFDLHFGNFYEAGIAMLEISPEIQKLNQRARKLAQEVIQSLTSLHSISELELKNKTSEVNQLSEEMNHYVYTETKHYLSQNQQVGIIGGDHSVPFGAIKAYLEKYPKMSILHIDAHADLRNAYEGFEYSHASIMHNVITKTSLKQLIQVGIRDFCEEEFNFINERATQIHTFYDSNLVEQKMRGKSWFEICNHIIQHLSDEVYISFDIDGLDPRYCPHTGTPVPGGLDYSEVLYLFKQVSDSGKKIIGFDLNEVSPGINFNPDFNADPSKEWDANVGARLLYKLCGLTMS